MTTVRRSADCGNSPKNQFAEDTAISIETGEAGLLKPALSKDFTWTNGVGDLLDATRFLASLAEPPQPATLTIHCVVTHGKAGAVSGTSISTTGRERSFCHVIQFANSKGTVIRAINTFGK